MDSILYPEQAAYLKKFHQTQDPLLLEMEQFAAANKIPILDSHSCTFLEFLVSVHKPRIVLEIGTAIGYTSIRLARVLGTTDSILTLEKSKPNIKLAQEFITRSGLSNITIVEGDALQTIPTITEELDFVFLDADKEDYSALFELAKEKLKVGGIMVVDNLLWHGMAAKENIDVKYERSTEFIRAFNDQFFSDTNFQTSFIPLGDGLGLGIKK